MPSPSPPLPVLSEKSEARVQELLRWKVARDMKEAISIVKMEEAMDEVDETVPLSSSPVGITRNFNLPGALDLSVVRPRTMPDRVEVKYMEYDNEVDYTCDQIRAMIKIFVRDGDWTLDEFRQCLKSVSRQQMTSFLEKRGQQGPQLRSAAYLKSWDFFNRREYLELPLSGCKFRDDFNVLLRLTKEYDNEHQKKMKRWREEYEEDRRTGTVAKRAKRQNRSDRKPLREIVNEADGV